MSEKKSNTEQEHRDGSLGKSPRDFSGMAMPEISKPVLFSPETLRERSRRHKELVKKAGYR